MSKTTCRETRGMFSRMYAVRNPSLTSSDIKENERARRLSASLKGDNVAINTRCAECSFLEEESPGLIDK